MKDRIKIIVFVSMLLLGGVLFLLVPDRDVSTFERRKLIGIKALKDDFLLNLEDYMNDQFPGRETFLRTASYLERNLLLNSSANDVYVKDGYLIEKNYPLDEKSLASFVDKIGSIERAYLNDSRVFFSLIPDKSFFLGDTALSLDFEYMERFIESGINAQHISAFDSFGLGDYYRTDIHIKQGSYERFVKELSTRMGFDLKERQFIHNKYDKFYGATYAKVPNVLADELEYLSDEYTDRAIVKHLEYGNRSVYDVERLGGIDSYDVFLGGASALIKIENPLYDGERELVIFRDSFASSLTPWLIPYYKRITLIDNRYISMDKVLDYVDFEGKDVLFLYSTLIANNSYLLKIDP